ncbi:MAG: phosphatidate cytidylyltransferase, partial [Kordiimonas sp.]
MPGGISRNLIERIVSAVLLLPPVLGAVYMGGWWFAALLMLGGILMATEWVKLTSAGGDFWGWLLALVMVALVSAVEVLVPNALDLLLLLFGLAALGSFFAKYTAFKPQAWWIIGLGYVALPLVALWWLRGVDGMLVLWVLLIVWATDIGGYFAGKGIGGPKLAPQVSPKKTWAGLLGGMALSVGVSVAVNAIEPLGLSLGLLALLSAGFAVWSQVGDLAESGVKRSFGVKDSGGLIPGHGGLLDRVDGLVFVAPAVALVV